MSHRTRARFRVLLPPQVIPTSLTIQTTQHGIMDGYFIYHWNERVDKSRCFDFADFLGIRDIEDTMGTDVGVIPHFWCCFRMRDHTNNNGILAETIRIVRGRGAGKDLHIPNPSFRSSATPNLSQFLQKLENCTGENAEVFHNHFKQSKLKIKGFGIDPNSKEVVTVIVSSFTGP